MILVNNEEASNFELARNMHPVRSRGAGWRQGVGIQMRAAHRLVPRTARHDHREDEGVQPATAGQLPKRHPTSTNNERPLEITIFYLSEPRYWLYQHRYFVSKYSLVYRRFTKRHIAHSKHVEPPMCAALVFVFVAMDSILRRGAGSRKFQDSELWLPPNSQRRAAA